MARTHEMDLVSYNYVLLYKDLDPILYGGGRVCESHQPPSIYATRLYRSPLTKEVWVRYFLLILTLCVNTTKDHICTIVFYLEHSSSVLAKCMHVLPYRSLQRFRSGVFGIAST